MWQESKILLDGSIKVFYIYGAYKLNYKKKTKFSSQVQKKYFAKLEQKNLSHFFSLNPK